MCVLDRAGTVLLNQACAGDCQVTRGTVARFGTDVRAAIEACSGPAELAGELVTRAGRLVALAHPGRPAGVIRIGVAVSSQPGPERG